MSVPVVASFLIMSTSAVETTTPAPCGRGRRRRALVAEWVGATGGLGPVIITALGVFETPLVFAAILYIVAMSIGLFVITTLVERGVNLWLYGRPE